jgi:hypothetical protein
MTYRRPNCQTQNPILLTLTQTSFLQNFLHGNLNPSSNIRRSRVFERSYSASRFDIVLVCDIDENTICVRS